MEEKTISKRKQLIRNTAIIPVVAIIVTTLASYLATGASIVAQERIYAVSDSSAHLNPVMDSWAQRMEWAHHAIS